MRPIPCFDVQDGEYGCTFSLSDRQGALLYSVSSKNEQWRNIRMHMLNECVMRNRIIGTKHEIGRDDPGALVCRDDKGYRIRFFSALGDDLAHTDIYVSEANPKNEQWRNMRTHMLNECVMSNRGADAGREIGGDGPRALICRDGNGYRIRFYSALGNELAYTDVYVDETQCMDVYRRIHSILKKQHVPVKFLR